MKRAGPLITLAAAVALGGGLLITDTIAGRSPEPVAATTATTTAGIPAPAVTNPAGTPSPSAAVTFPAQADYVAVIATAGRPITLSVTVTGAKSVAYACDGAAVETWLQGAADSGRTTLTGKDSRIEAALTGESLRGTLTLSGRSYDFTAPAVQPPAGMYIARTNAGRDSWIVGPDGSVTGVRRNPDGSTTPAPGLAPNARKVTGDDNDF